MFYLLSSVSLRVDITILSASCSTLGIYCVIEFIFHYVIYLPYILCLLFPELHLKQTSNYTFPHLPLMLISKVFQISFLGLQIFVILLAKSAFVSTNYSH